MRGLILAAGRGSRLGILTGNQPKCLVKLAGKTLVDWQVAALRSVGIDEIGIVRGYLGQTIRHSNLICFDNPDWSESNMVFSFLCARDWLEGHQCVVSYGDIVFHPDAVSRLLAARFDISVTYDTAWRSLWEERFDDPGQDAESFQVRGGLVRRLGEKPCCLNEVEGQYMGLMKLSPGGWLQIDKFTSRLDNTLVRKSDFTSLISRLTKGGVAIGAVPVHGRWCEIDRQEDLDLYERRISSSEPWVHDWRF